MTRQEYDILREHGERLLAIEDGLRELPGRIADRMKVKMATAIASCREQHDEDETRLDELWEGHLHEQGARGFLATASKRTSFIIGSVGGIVGVAGVLCAIFW